MKNQPLPEQSHRTSGRTALRLIIGVLGGLVLLAIFSCGFIAYLIYGAVNQTVTEVRDAVDEVKRDFAAADAEYRERVDENRRRNLVANANARAKVFKEKYELSRKLLADRERIGADSRFSPFDAHPMSGYLRAVHENPESFETELQIRDEFAQKLEAAKTWNECQRVAAELEIKVLAIRTERYRRELQSLRASVASQLAEVSADAYCVVEVTPPISEFASAAHGVALSFDLIAGMWLVSAANLGETPALPFSQSILESAGKPRVAVIRGRDVAEDYIIESVFAENRFEGVSSDACPWRLVTATLDETTARAAAEKTAARLRAARKPDPASGKSADPRPVVVVHVPEAK